MTTTIKLKNSVTTTNTPSSLEQGEVAINVTDRKVWVGNAATTPVQLLGAGATGSFSALSCTTLAATDVATFSAGTVSAPAITTTGDTNTGIFFPAADTIAFTENGTESMRIDSIGNVGIGTTPAAWGSGWKALQITNAGPSLWSDANERSFFSNNLYFDGTNRKYLSNGFASEYQQSSSGTHIWTTAISGTAGADVILTQRMIIDSSGNLLVGTTSGSDKLTVAGASSLFTNTAGSQTLTLSCRNNVADFARLSLSVPGYDSSSITYDRNNARLTVVNSSVGVYLASGGNSWTGVSDERVKENLVPITDAVNKVSTLRSVTGNYIKDENKKSRSFLIAQDVQAVLPEAVDSTNPEELGVSYTDVIPLLVAAIKELKTELDTVKAELQTLKGN